MTSHASSGVPYVIVWIVLMALTGASVGLAEVSLGALGPVVALGIAFTKATLVGIYFMHLREARFATQMVAVLNLLFVLLLCLGLVADVAFR